MAGFLWLSESIGTALDTYSFDSSTTACEGGHEIRVLPEQTVML